jgi:hypothetical protein
MKHAKQAAFLILTAGIALTGCGSSSKPQATHPTTGGTPAQASSPAGSAETSVQLAWSHTGTFFGDPRVWYVAKVTNRGSSPASAALDVRALDSTGTIVGSGQETLPNIPARSSFDFFGYLGGGAGPQLTGTPAKIEVSLAENAFGRAGSVFLPMLKTSEVTLTAGNTDTGTDMTHSYDLTAKVTNTTSEPVTAGVTQQVVLYTQAGQIVGGDTGSSDNVPQNLPSGMSYRESFTGIPTMQAAVRAEYTVWPASLLSERLINAGMAGCGGLAAFRVPSG